MSIVGGQPYFLGVFLEKFSAVVQKSESCQPGSVTGEKSSLDLQRKLTEYGLPGSPP
jgi:hypothetical protein